MKGILLINLGSPDSTSTKDVRKYLDEFLMDERVIDMPYWKRFLLVKGIILNTRPKKSAAAYKKIWWKEGSPLEVISERFTEKFEQGDVMYRKKRSILFKKMRIVRGCDSKRNTLVYLVYSDKVIEGSPKNSTSTVPIMPWGNQTPSRCEDFLE